MWFESLQTQHAVRRASAMGKASRKASACSVSKICGGGGAVSQHPCSTSARNRANWRRAL